MLSISLNACFEFIHDTKIKRLKISERNTGYLRKMIFVIFRFHHTSKSPQTYATSSIIQNKHIIGNLTLYGSLIGNGKNLEKIGTIVLTTFVLILNKVFGKNQDGTCIKKKV
jgi:hypothetical protein